MELLDPLSLVISSPWTYVLIAAVAALDALVPIVPSEATVISAGALAGVGDLEIAYVLLAGAGGAFLGDNSSYGVGRLLRHRLPERATRVAERFLRGHGGLFIVVARFIPGGRTAATLGAGATMAPARFMRLAALAAVVWALYAGLLGYAGGRTFEDEPWKAIAAGLLLAGALALLAELARRLVKRSSQRSAAPAACAGLA